MTQLPEPIKHVIDWAAVASTLVSFLHVWPEVMTGISMTVSSIWFSIRIYETKTFKVLFRKDND